MSLNPGFLFLSIIISGIGLALFAFGKREQRWPFLVAGVLCLVYPYFVETVTQMLVVGAVIGVVLWWLWREGH